MDKQQIEKFEKVKTKTDNEGLKLSIDQKIKTLTENKPVNK